MLKFSTIRTEFIHHCGGWLLLLFTHQIYEGPEDILVIFHKSVFTKEYEKNLQIHTVRPGEVQEILNMINISHNGPLLGYTSVFQVFLSAWLVCSVDEFP